MTVVEQDHQAGRPTRRRRVARRLALVGLLGAAAALLGAGAAAPAWAGVALTVTPDPPGAVVVGQTGVPATLTLANASTGAQAGQRLTLDQVTLVVGCGTQATTGADCPAAAADHASLRPSAAGRGLAGTACDGTAFTISLIDPTQGKYRFAPSAAVVLGPPGSATAACIVGFTVDVARVPAADADPAIPGVQTVTVAYAQGVADGGLRAAASGSDELTVAAASLPISTSVAPATVALGGSFRATATLAPAAATAPPTGLVSFSVYGPTDTGCAGPPLLRATAPLNAAGTAATSTGLVAVGVGTLRVSATYAGDADNAPAVGACGGAALVTVTGADEPPPAAYTPSSDRRHARYPRLGRRSNRQLPGDGRRPGRDDHRLLLGLG